MKKRYLKGQGEKKTTNTEVPSLPTVLATVMNKVQQTAVFLEKDP